MPSTRCRLAGLWKRLSRRARTIAKARLGPIRGNTSRLCADARFKSMARPKSRRAGPRRAGRALPLALQATAALRSEPLRQRVEEQLVELLEEARS